MAPPASAPNPPPPAPPDKVDELRGVLASKGLVVKDSILARLAKSKSFNAEKLALTQAEPGFEMVGENADPTITQTSGKDEGSEPQTSISKEPDQDVSGNLLSNGSKKNEKHEGSNSPATAGCSVMAVTEVTFCDEDEPKLHRSECLGSVSEDEKLKLRAARFGITHDVREEAEKKRARAARFGIVDEDAKKKARLERFGTDTREEDDKENERRKARGLRFATATATAMAKLD